MAQGTDKGLDAPMPERGMLDQTQAAWCPSCGLGPVGLDRDLVDECQRPYHDCQTPLILLEWKFFVLPLNLRWVDSSGLVIRLPEFIG